MSTKEELYDGSWVENQNVTDVTCVRCQSVYNTKTSTKKRLKKYLGIILKNHIVTVDVDYTGAI